LDKQAEWWGNIYFCSECFGEISRVANFGNVQRYVERIHELEHMTAELSQKVNTYESALFSIQSVSIVPNSFDDGRMVGVALDSTESVQLGSADKRKSRTSEQTDDSLVDGVRESTADSEPSLELRI
jgi:hypothetical protein